VKTIRQPQPALATQAEAFERGRQRKIIVCLHPTRMYLRFAGSGHWHVLNYGSALLHAAAAEAGFDPSPAKRARKGGGR